MTTGMYKQMIEAYPWLPPADRVLEAEMHQGSDGLMTVDLKVILTPHPRRSQASGMLRLLARIRGLCEAVEVEVDELHDVFRAIHQHLDALERDLEAWK